ncbi:MAG: vWA domain-containing protein, partial [Vulcanimicrobiaceae bacterium]
MSFERPVWLFAAIVLAIAAAATIALVDRMRRKEAFAYSNLPFLLDATRVSAWPFRIAAAAVAFGTFLGGVALAGPSLVVPVPSRNGTVVLCLDTSGSMRANDIEPSREIAVRTAARSFVRSAPQGTRIGIVSFATSAIRIANPSEDKRTIIEALDDVPSANGATAIGDAMALAGEMLPARGLRAVVLVTDGVNNRGADPLEVAQQLGARGVRIYTVGIGTNGSGLAIPGTNEEASIDEDALRAFAAAGHGKYTRTTDASAIAGTLESLARTTVWERRLVVFYIHLAAE